jgi:hypothetical protein
MNPLDILRYGHQTLMAALDRVPDSEWITGSVCGHWSAKDVLAHLSAYELWHVEVLGTFQDIAPGPMMSAHASGDFNDGQVGLRHDFEVQAVLNEYQAAHKSLMERAAELPGEAFTRVGSMPWYGAEYSLDDFLVYSNYGHKREHSAQLNVFTDQFGPTP